MAAERWTVLVMRSERYFWPTMAVLLSMAGILGAVAGAHAVAANDAQRSRQAFITSSQQVASSLTLAIQHEEDLSVSSRGFVISNPDATQAQFLRWTATVDAFARYPELLVIAQLALVPASQLAAFSAHASADPAGTLTSGGSYQVIQAGARPYYCLATGVQTRTVAQRTPAATDYCTTALGPQLLAARDSGKGAYLPYGSGKAHTLAVGTPIYRGGGTPATVQGRRNALIGWTGLQITPRLVLGVALRGHPDTAVTFNYRDGMSDATFRAGSAPPGAQSTVIDLHNRWHVRTFAVVGGSSVLANKNALGLLVGGILFSVALGALLYALGSSRSRAIVLARERTEDLHHQAFHDSLTGLANRHLILDRIGQMMDRARRDGTPMALLFLDLDNFKDINDSLGHRVGDQLLAGVGNRLVDALRAGDSVGRLGGDEFVVLVEGASVAMGGEAVAERILRALKPCFEVADSDLPLVVTASIGIAEGVRSTPEDLLRDADIALYRAKSASKNCAVTFSSSMQSTLDEQRSLELDLYGALEAGQFFLLYQPIVELATGQCTGVEALLRWRHPERGVVQPDQFIPALESSGLIVPVGLWVLEEACRQGAAWHRQGFRISVSVNISSRQLERDRIVDDTQRALSASGFDAAWLVLEVTETVLMQQIESTIPRLDLLKAIGVRLSLDDFGTGWSSISYLQQLPIDIVKIDRSFVSRITDRSQGAAVLHTMAELGRALGLITVAEGIETDEQLSLLRADCIDYGQGFLFARPLDVETMGFMLETPAYLALASPAIG